MLRSLYSSARFLGERGASADDAVVTKEPIFSNGSEWSAQPSIGLVELSYNEYDGTSRHHCKTISNLTSQDHAQFRAGHRGYFEAAGICARYCNADSLADASHLTVFADNSLQNDVTRMNKLSTKYGQPLRFFVVSEEQCEKLSQLDASEEASPKAWPDSFWAKQGCRSL